MGNLGAEAASPTGASAAIGDTRPARTAGQTEANVVIPTPTTSPTAAARDIESDEGQPRIGHGVGDHDEDRCAAPPEQDAADGRRRSQDGSLGDGRPAQLGRIRTHGTEQSHRALTHGDEHAERVGDDKDGDEDRHGAEAQSDPDQDIRTSGLLLDPLIDHFLLGHHRQRRQLLNLLPDSFLIRRGILAIREHNPDLRRRGVVRQPLHAPSVRRLRGDPGRSAMPTTS